MAVLSFINNNTKSPDYKNSIQDSYNDFKNTFENWFKGNEIAGNFQGSESNSSSNSTKNKIKNVFKEAVFGKQPVNLLGFDNDTSDELYGSAFLRAKAEDGGFKIIPIIITNYSYSHREKFYAPVTSYNGKNVLYLGENANEPILNISFVIPENKSINTYELITNYYEEYNVSSSNGDGLVELLVNNTIYKGYWLDLAIRSNNEFSNLIFGQLTLLVDHIESYTENHPNQEHKKVKILIKEKSNEKPIQMPIIIRQVTFSEREAFQQLTSIYGTNNGFFSYGKIWPQIISISGLYPIKSIYFKDLDAFDLTKGSFEYTNKLIEELYEKGSVNGDKDTFVYLVLLDKVYKGKFIAKSDSAVEDMEFVNSIGLNMLLLEKEDIKGYKENVQNNN